MIRLDHVEKRYGATCALKDVTLDIPDGGVFGIIGPNGAGKTTALRLIAGLARPTRGRVTADRGTIGYLPQAVALNRLATPREILRLFARLRGLPPSAGDSALRAGGLAAEADRQVRVLSGGMRQRVALAIACLGDRAVLLLDEPSAGLDPRAAVELRREMRRLADAGRTVVVSSHSLPELECVCDRVALLLDGRVILEGELSEITRGGSISLDDLFMEATA